MYKRARARSVLMTRLCFVNFRSIQMRVVHIIIPNYRYYFVF